MEKRKYGKHDDMLSIVGFGGILVSQEEPSESERLVAKAIDRGINYFDVAPTYGNAEERLGPALQPYRNDVFLACKTTKRSAEESEAELHNSLKLLRTDHFDLETFEPGLLAATRQLRDPVGRLAGRRVVARKRIGAAGHDDFVVRGRFADRQVRRTNLQRLGEHLVPQLGLPTDWPVASRFPN